MPASENPAVNPNPLLAAIAQQRKAERLRTSGRRYQGPAYGFGATVDSVLGPKGDYEVVTTSMVNIITTPFRSVPYGPGIGSEIPDLLFEVLDDVTLSLIRYYTKKRLAEQEPRIKIVGVFVARRVFAGSVDENGVSVSVGYQIKGDPTGRTYGLAVPLSRDDFGGGV